MKYFKCKCGWRYVLTQKRVFGPIFEDNDASAARVMQRTDWKYQYSDCAYNLRHNK